ncbi:MAG TPA: ATP-binding protein [Chloroflexia bacterium]|nr:ATP-binding protein [Chloroflexia bacterium]
MAVRIAALYLTTTLLVLLALGGGLYLTTERTLIEARHGDLDAYVADDAAFFQQAGMSAAELQVLAPALAPSLPNAGTRTRTVRVFSGNGTLLSAQPADIPDSRAHPSQATLAWLPRGLLALTLTPYDRPGLIYAARPIYSLTAPGQATIVGVVEVAESRTDIDGVLNQLRTGFAGAAGLAALLAVGAGLLLARSVARPVRRLEAVATAIAAGDLARRARDLPRNEIGTLGESFNRMAERLAGLLAEARGEQARLAALLTSLADGVLACDIRQTLTLENPAAREMLGVPRDAPRAIVGEVVASLGLDALWRRAMGQDPTAPHPGPAEAELQAAGHALLAVVVPIYDGAGPQVGGAVCVLRDITRLRELEQGRTAVLRRLGHELRTPLTALRTMLANLSDAAQPAEAAALAAAEAEAARLSRLVEEILALSQGRPATRLDQRPTDLRAVAAATCTLFVGRATRLGVDLQGPAPGDLPIVVRGDPDRLRQVLVNLLDNALRHTPPGGQVGVTVAAAGGEAILQVRDDGEGMDPLTSRWAFEPYYQAERSAPPPAGPAPDAAARPPGSSGLGLTIVREIVAAHGGTVALESRPASGTTVRVRLPLAAGGLG